MISTGSKMHYGAGWITPKGEVVENANLSHAGMAQEILYVTDAQKRAVNQWLEAQLGDSSYYVDDYIGEYALIAEGWLKFSFHGNIFVQYVQKMAPGAKKKLIELIGAPSHLDKTINVLLVESAYHIYGVGSVDHSFKLEEFRKVLA
jgi:hypothetical protein